MYVPVKLGFETMSTPQIGELVMLVVVDKVWVTVTSPVDVVKAVLVTSTVLEIVA